MKDSPPPKTGKKNDCLRKAFVMSVFPGFAQEYEKRHSPIWPELETVLREHGVRSYSIFLHPDTLHLFAFVEITDEARWNALPANAICQKWWKYMAPIMPSQEDHRPVSLPLKEVFRLEKNI